MFGSVRGAFAKNPLHWIIRPCGPNDKVTVVTLRQSEIHLANHEGTHLAVAWCLGGLRSECGSGRRGSYQGCRETSVLDASTDWITRPPVAVGVLGLAVSPRHRLNVGNVEEDYTRSFVSQSIAP